MLIAARVSARITAPAVTAQTPALSVGVNGRANEHVTIATAGSTIALVWAATVPDGTTDIYAAMSRDTGATFAAPVRVNSTPGDARVNGEQPPRIALVPRAGALPDVVVVWTARGQIGTRLLTARSRDGGKTFGATALVAGAEAAGNRGWEALAVTAAGTPVVLWLDHRETVGSSGGHTHGAAHETAPRADGAARAQLSHLFIGAADGSLPPRSLARGVCYCCKTALASGPGGALYAAWRHVYPGNQRDIAVIASADGGRTFSAPARVSEDKWQIDGCPENGPAIAVDGRQVHVVWPTLVRRRGTELLELFRATTTDGRTFSPRVPPPVSGQAYHPQIAVGRGGMPIIAWEETAPGGRRIKLWRGAAVEDLGAGTYPAVSVSDGRAIVAWAARRDGREELAVRRF
jgi:hypothetical protein